MPMKTRPPCQESLPARSQHSAPPLQSLGSWRDNELPPYWWGAQAASGLSGPSTSTCRCPGSCWAKPWLREGRAAATFQLRNPLLRQRLHDLLLVPDLGHLSRLLCFYEKISR